MLGKNSMEDRGTIVWLDGVVAGSRRGDRVGGAGGVGAGPDTGALRGGAGTVPAGLRGTDPERGCGGQTPGCGGQTPERSGDRPCRRFPARRGRGAERGHGAERGQTLHGLLCTAFLERPPFSGLSWPSPRFALDSVAQNAQLQNG